MASNNNLIKNILNLIYIYIYIYIKNNKKRKGKGVAAWFHGGGEPTQVSHPLSFLYIYLFICLFNFKGILFEF
jgi:hypothetical protein